MVKESDIFRCQQCGYCCHGETTVSLDEADQQRMVEHLKMPAEEVRERYWRVRDGVVQMKIVDGHCIFYNRGCTIHAGKPWRCGQWPLHPSMLADENNFLSIKESCPGINRKLGYADFRAKLEKFLRQQKKN